MSATPCQELPTRHIPLTLSPSNRPTRPHIGRPHNDKEMAWSSDRTPWAFLGSPQTNNPQAGMYIGTRVLSAFRGSWTSYHKIQAFILTLSGPPLGAFSAEPSGRVSILHDRRTGVSRIVLAGMTKKWRSLVVADASRMLASGPKWRMVSALARRPRCALSGMTSRAV